MKRNSRIAGGMTCLLFLFGCGGRTGYVDGMPSSFIDAVEPTYWQATSLPQGNDVRSFQRSQSGYLFVASSKRGIYRSADGGQAWDLAYASPAYCLSQDSEGKILMGTDWRGILSSSDNGITWLRRGLDGVSVLSLYANQSLMLAGSLGQGVFRSTDGGTTWIAGEAGLRNLNVYCFAIVHSGDILAGTSRGVFVSQGGSGPWTSLGITHGAVRSLRVHSGNLLYAATSEGIYCSTNGGESWTLRSNGLLNRNVWTITANSSGDLFVGTKEGVFQSGDQGLNWSSISSGLRNGYVRSSYVNEDGYLFVGTNGNGIYRSIRSTLQ